MDKLVILNQNDNVAIASQRLVKGETVNFAGKSLKMLNDVPAGNKVALQDLNAGQEVVKLGAVIGQLSKNAASGQMINQNNLIDAKSDTVAADQVKFDASQYISKQTFMGYRRKSGKVGIRNDLYIVPTVGCITPLMDVMVQQFKAIHPDNGSFDNIILLKHPYGCSQLGEDFAQTRQILCDAALQPNAGGVLVFGLGCENNQMDGMKETIDKMAGIDPTRMKFLVAQQVNDEFATAQQMLEELNQAAANDHREPIPLKELKIGLQSVQPDALAPVTSDRLLARLADFVNANGGTTVLTGLPDLAAHEKELVNRATDDQAKNDVKDVFAHLGDYYKHFDEQMVKDPNENDQKDGVTTAQEKAVNALHLGGQAPIAGALKYDKKLENHGLNLLEAPNNDLIDSSAEASADCQMVIASVGAATPYASYVPSIKVASNTELAIQKPQWFDFNGGQVMGRSFDDVAKDFINQIIKIASGQKTKNEKAGLHGLAIFKIGVTE